MKNLILMSLTVLTSFYSYSQSPLKDMAVELSWGTEKKIDLNQFVIHANEKSIYLMGVESETIFSDDDFNISKVNRVTKDVEWIVELEDLEYMDADIKVYGVEVRKNKVYIIYRSYNKSNDRHYLLCQTIDENAHLSSLFEIANVPSDDDDDGEINSQWLEGNRGLLIHISPQYEDEEDNRKLTILHYDTAFNLIHNSVINLPYSYEYSEIIDLTHYSGKYFLMLSKEPEKHKGEEKIRNTPNKSWFMYEIDSTGTQVVEYDLGYDSLYISSLRLNINDSSGTLNISGIYKEDDHHSGARGVIFKSMNPVNMTTHNAIVHDFTEDEIKLMEINIRSGFFAGANSKENNLFQFRNQIIRTDGGSILVFENSYSYKVSYSTPNGGYSSYTVYVDRELLIVNFSPSGNIDWITAIPKFTKVTDKDIYGGYTLLVGKDKIHFVYLDHEDNREHWVNPSEERFKSVSSGRNSVIALTTVHSNGDVAYEVLAEGRDEDKFYYYPRRGKQVFQNDKEAIVVAVKRSKFKLGELKIE